MTAPDLLEMSDERKRTFHAATSINERYRVITELLSNIICETDSNGIATYVSPSCKNVLGFTADQLVGHPIFDLVHPDDASDALIAFHSAITEKGTGRAEIRYRTIDGTYVWMEAMGSAVYNVDGTVQGALIICHDINERVHKERELRVQNALRQAALNSTDNALFALDTQFRYTVFNKAHEDIMYRIYGCDVAQGKSILDIVHRDDERLVLKEFIQTVLAGKAVAHQVIRFRDGQEEIFCQVSGNPIHDGGGDVAGVVVVSREVTAAYRTEEHRNQQLLLLSTLLNGIPVPVFYNDTNGRYLGVNKAFEDLIGKSKEELIGHTLLDSIRDNPAAELTLLNQKVLSTGKPIVHPTSFYTNDGQTLQVLVHMAPFIDQSGSVAGSIGVIMDVTELKQMQDRLRASLEDREMLVRELDRQHAYFRQLFETSPEAIAILDTDGRIIDVNHVFEDLFQYAAAEARGSSFHDIIIPPEQLDDEAARWKPRESTVLLRTETIRKRKDGTRFPVAISASPVVLDRNRLGVCAIFQDLTKKKAAEAKLRQLSRAVEQSPASILITDTTGAIEYVNPTFSSVTGYVPEEVLGKNPRILKSGMVQEETYADLWKTIIAGKEWVGELLNKTKHGDLYWELVHVSPVTDEDGVITHYLAVKEDITERKSVESLRAYLEAELRTRNAELEKSIAQIKAMQSGLIQSEKMASLGLLTAGIAHEINNPLAYISSNLNRFDEYFNDVVNLLERWDAILQDIRETHPGAFVEIKEEEDLVDLPFLKEDFRNLMQHACEGIDRIRSIVNQLRGFSHMGSGITDDVSAEQALEDTVILAWNEIKYKATVVRDYGNIPPVRCSASEIKQVLVNLVINAAHAIEKTGTITLRTSVRDGKGLVEIEDTGCGIPSDILPRIFDPFFTTKPVGKGTGLGLWISATIVQKYGGTISVESTVGTGTKFTIALPLQKEAKG